MYILDASTIRAPQEIREANSTQVAVQRTLDGSINRDYFGSNKRIWELDYTNIKKSDYDIINAIYQNYLLTGNTKTWEITEANYTISQVNVHIDLLARQFTVRGSSYISDFTLTLTEA